MRRASTRQLRPLREEPDGGEEIIHRSPQAIMDEIALLDARVRKCWRTFEGCYECWVADEEVGRGPAKD